jgi:CheY-like chemotaxis protein
LITLDIVLPHMDGWELLARLKQVQALRRTPVVIISGVVDRKKAFALGAAGVVQKPIARKELSEALIDLGLVAPAKPPTLKILVVDDDPRALELVALRVRGLASTILRASGGAQAIEIARRERPDLVVLDLMMPDVSGFDVAEALKNAPDTANIPILVLTAKRVTAEDRTKLSDSVMTIMEKADFDRERFAAEVQRAMSRRHSAHKEMASVVSEVGPQHGPRILIVDDDRHNTETLAIMLGSEDYLISTATNGEDALEQATLKQPDLVLLDIMLPGMDGYEVAARIKSNPATANIPVIMVSALDDRETKLLGLTAGAEDFLSKPVHRAELASRVRKLLGRTSGLAEGEQPSAPTSQTIAAHEILLSRAIMP